jgi:hypothetical protein
MLHCGINDIRIFHENDVRFLRQFWQPNTHLSRTFNCAI